MLEYRKMFNQRANISACKYPCTFLETKISSKIIYKDSAEIQASFTFNRFIQVTESYLAYTELELLAEIGGYVGLFLGFSILQLKIVIERLLAYIPE